MPDGTKIVEFRIWNIGATKGQISFNPDQRAVTFMTTEAERLKREEKGISVILDTFRVHDDPRGR